MLIIKRDGRKRKFNVCKIHNAIESAYKDVYNNDLTIFNQEYPFLKSLILKRISEKNIDEIHIEDIQDIIINVLNKINKEVSKAYKNYREERERIRITNHYIKLKEDIINKQSIENSNANIDENNFGAIK